MDANDAVWIGQDGTRYGPYEVDDLRQWLAQGKLAADALAWRAGMPEWVPLGQLLRHAPEARRLPPVPPTPPSRPTDDPGGTLRDRPDERRDGRDAPYMEARRQRAELPPPPSLHWGWVLLLYLVTLGIFGIIWPFIQASWVRKIDPNSHARMMLAIGFVANFAVSLLGNGPAGPSGFAMLVHFGFLVVFITAYFSMAGSVERAMADTDAHCKIRGATLFFFTTFYLQGQMTWLARWKQTGQTAPAPPKGVFWLLWTVPLVLGILAAIAIPAYRDYTTRVQVGAVVAQARGMQDQISRATAHLGRWPENNHQAGMRPPAAYAQGIVAGFQVEPINDGARLLVQFAPRAPRAIRGKHLVMEAHPQGGAIVWSCQSPDIRSQYLPPDCR